MNERLRSKRPGRWGGIALALAAIAVLLVMFSHWQTPSAPAAKPQSATAREAVRSIFDAWRERSPAVTEQPAPVRDGIASNSAPLLVAILVLLAAVIAIFAGFRGGESWEVVGTCLFLGVAALSAQFFLSAFIAIMAVMALLGMLAALANYLGDCCCCGG